MKLCNRTADCDRYAFRKRLTCPWGWPAASVAGVCDGDIFCSGVRA